MSELSEVGVGTRTIERLVYQEIPLLTDDDFAQDSCLIGTNRYDGKELFVGGIAEALKSPGWIISPEKRIVDGKEYVYGHDLPRMFKFDLQRIADGKIKPAEKDPRYDDPYLQIANMLNEGMTWRLIPNADESMEMNVVVRGLDILSERYPNLTLYRGADFDPIGGFSGRDFSFADPEESLHYAARSFDGKKRVSPVLVMLKVPDLVRSFATGRLTIGTEGNWYRNSLEINGRKNELDQIVKVRRVPGDPAVIEELLKSLETKSIQLSKKAQGTR